LKVNSKVELKSYLAIITVQHRHDVLITILKVEKSSRLSKTTVLIKKYNTKWKPW